MTKATITVELKKGGFRTVVLYYEGHPEAAGRILANHYETYRRAKALVDRGDIAYLGESIRKTQFDREMNGPTDTESFSGAIESITAPESGTKMVDWHYLYSDGAWKVSRAG